MAAAKSAALQTNGMVHDLYVCLSISLSVLLTVARRHIKNSTTNIYR